MHSSVGALPARGYVFLSHISPGRRRLRAILLGDSAPDGGSFQKRRGRDRGVDTESREPVPVPRLALHHALHVSARLPAIMRFQAAPLGTSSIVRTSSICPERNSASAVTRATRSRQSAGARATSMQRRVTPSSGMSCASSPSRSPRSPATCLSTSFCSFDWSTDDSARSVAAG